MVHFNPRTPLQSAIPRRSQCWTSAANFNPRTPLQSAIVFHFRISSQAAYFNPRTPLQSAMDDHYLDFVMLHISIHALHYRVRLGFDVDKLVNDIISIHALHYRVRSLEFLIYYGANSFQSTHSITECDPRADDPPSRLVIIFQSTHSITECDYLNLNMGGHF